MRKRRLSCAETYENRMDVVKALISVSKSKQWTFILLVHIKKGDNIEVFKSLTDDSAGHLKWEYIKELNDFPESNCFLLGINKSLKSKTVNYLIQEHVNQLNQQERDLVLEYTIIQCTQ